MIQEINKPATEAASIDWCSMVSTTYHQSNELLSVVLAVSPRDSIGAMSADSLHASVQPS